MREGQWRQDRLDGHGRAVEADGAWYEGGFDAGRRGGTQRLELPSLQALLASRGGGWGEGAPHRPYPHPFAYAYRYP